MLGYFLESTRSEYYKRNEFLFFGLGKLMFVFPKTGVGVGRWVGMCVCMPVRIHSYCIQQNQKERT